jgi:hypothetical protein
MVLSPYWKWYELDITRGMKAARERDDRDDEIYGWQGHRLYCVHGTYVGDPYGPDYMCGACEDSVTVYEYALGLAFSRQRKATHDFRQAALMAILNEVPTEEQHSLISAEKIRRVVDLGCAIANGQAVITS